LRVVGEVDTLDAGILPGTLREWSFNV